MVTLTIDEQRMRWGAAIRDARVKHGLSQEKLAGLWRFSLAYLQKIESGIRGNEEMYHELMDLLGEPRRKRIA